jgi:hypothetical protein
MGNQRIIAASSSIGIAILLCLTSPVSAASNTSGNAPTAMAGKGANVRCLRVLGEVQDLKDAAESAIVRDDIEGLGKLHTLVRTKVRDAQIQMDHAFLVGAWKPAEYKRDAADLMGRLEGVEILNFISLAFLNGYDHPSKKVPASVADATRKMFVHLNGVTERLRLLNKSVE